MALRDLVRHTGVLHEVQVKNVTAWGKLVFEHAVIDTRIDTDECLVEYTMRNKGRQPSKFKQRLKFLDTSIKWLLGPEWRYRLLDGKKVVFASKRAAQWTNKKDREGKLWET